MVSPGLIPKIFEKMGNARRPTRFTQDFLETKLGHSGGSARAVIPLLKRMEFLAPDGSPTPLYDQCRNIDTQGHAVAEGMRKAFDELFARNEYAYDLSREKLTSLVTEITGAAKGDRTTQATVSTFWALKELADFEADVTDGQGAAKKAERVPESVAVDRADDTERALVAGTENVELRVGYTINLNLPETSDPEVFNAIFKALRENLLKN